MTTARAEGLLAALEEVRRLRPGAQRAEELLAAIDRTVFDDAADLVCLHETLLFLRAYPHSTEVLRRSERLLRSFGGRVARLAEADGDLAVLEDRECSGISGTAIDMVFTFDFARWLAGRFPRAVRISWDGYEGADRLGAALPRFIPLVEEEALTEANVPYRDWLEAARPRKDTDITWLLSRFDALGLSPAEKAELYDALGIWVLWELGDSWATRTRMRRPSRRPFADDGPLLSRRDVSLAKELDGPPLPVRRLSSREGDRALDLCRAAMGTRYRELYAFTYGDPSRIVSAGAGRGLEILLVGIAPERRLPLRVGYGVAFFRNGVPVGYGDAFGLFDRLDVSLNVFPAFREGESAFVYARLLRLYRQLFGSTCFCVDRYQIGFGNEEAIDSGAFWFYRKLGFRSQDPALEKLATREEERTRSRVGYRTPKRTLERLAGAGLLFEIGERRGEWDRFRVRNLGLAAARRMAASGLDAEAFRRRTESDVCRALGIDLRREKASIRRAVRGLSPVLDLVKSLLSWPERDRSRLRAVLRAKGSGSEELFLAELRHLPLLRTAILRAGSVG